MSGVNMNFMRYLNIVLLVSLLTVSKALSQPLSLMTYNIRLDVSSDKENAWPNRKAFLTSQIRFYAPDIFGVQEARPNQMAYLKDNLTKYEAFGQGRDGGSKGEHSSIFYNKDKIQLLQSGTFWLSETPDEVSKGWDAAYPRICTYGLFKHIDSENTFWVFNTHLDHQGVESRRQGVQLILNKIITLNNQNRPYILMGDLNASPESEVITALSNRLDDSRLVSKINFGPEGTFNDFDHQRPVNRRIDYIMLSKEPKISVEKYGTLSSTIDLRFPSDHFPVYVELTLN